MKDKIREEKQRELVSGAYPQSVAEKNLAKVAKSIQNEGKQRITKDNIISMIAKEEEDQARLQKALKTLEQEAKKREASQKPSHRDPTIQSQNKAIH